MNSPPAAHAAPQPNLGPNRESPPSVVDMRRGRPAQAPSAAQTRTEAPAIVVRSTPSRAAQLIDFSEHFRKRVMQDALAEATRSYWLRRAATFDAVGNARCDETAQACRAAAAMALIQDDEIPSIVCPICGTQTSPWTCSCGQTRIQAS